MEGKSHGTVITVCGCVTMASILDAIGVNAGCGPLRGTSQWVAIATIIIDVFQIEGMDVAGEVAGRYRWLVFEYGGSLDIWYKTHPRIVSRTLIQKSTPQPAIIKTPRGGTVWFC